MADRDNMSVDQMLAACRQADGGGASESAPAQEKPVAEAKPAKETAAPAAAEGGAKPAGGKSGGAMSVAEMMAAARASDAGGGKSAAKAEPKEAAAKPTAAAGGKPPGQMSVAEMMAAARGEKSGGGATAKEKPAAKAGGAKPPAAKAKAPAAEKTPSGPKDTQSILAAARKGDKSGPMSKSEAAAREKSKEVAAQPADARKSPKQAPPMPEKPAYARPTPAQARDDEETRRGFFGLFLGSYLAVGFTSLGLVNLLWTLGFARFMFPNILTEPPTKFKVGPPDNFAPGAVETKFKAQFGVWIVNTLYNGMQIIFALKTVCTHLGCTPNWLEAEQKFKCPCHGSGFYKDGINFEGPAPRPLERYAIKKADDGQLEVDKSKTFQEEKGQWTDGTSYVSV